MYFPCSRVKIREILWGGACCRDRPYQTFIEGVSTAAFSCAGFLPSHGAMSNNIFSSPGFTATSQNIVDSAKSIKSVETPGAQEHRWAETIITVSHNNNNHSE